MSLFYLFIYFTKIKTLATAKLSSPRWHWAPQDSKVPVHRALDELVDTEDEYAEGEDEDVPEHDPHPG